MNSFCCLRSENIFSILIISNFSFHFMQIKTLSNNICNVKAQLLLVNMVH